VPKPLLPVLNVPVIEYAVREAANSGITDIALVMSPGMESVADYFSPQPQLEQALEARGQVELLKAQREISSLAEISTLYQEEPRGPGHAVLIAREFVGNEAFAVIFPDDVIRGETPALKQLINVRNTYGGSVVAAMEVSDEVVERKGIIDGEPVTESVYSVKALVEKPKLADAPSNLSIVARYVLEPVVFEHLAQERSGAGGEIQLTDAIQATIGAFPVHACVFQGKHADTGNPGGMLEAALFEASNDPALRKLVLDAVAGW
jgi:UTP--glucose-1-phosphate uridylyltransferase